MKCPAPAEEQNTYRYRQPAGTLCVDVATKDGSIRGMQLYGGVRQSDVLQSEVE